MKNIEGEKGDRAGEIEKKKSKKENCRDRTGRKKCEYESNKDRSTMQLNNKRRLK